MNDDDDEEKKRIIEHWPQWYGVEILNLTLPKVRLHLCLNSLKQGTPLSNYERGSVSRW